MPLCWVPLWRMSVCSMLRKTEYCLYTDCHCADYHWAERLHADCHCTKCPNAECHNSDYHYAERYSANWCYADCRGVLVDSTRRSKLVIFKQTGFPVWDSTEIIFLSTFELAVWKSLKNVWIKRKDCSGFNIIKHLFFVTHASGQIRWSVRPWIDIFRLP